MKYPLNYKKYNKLPFILINDNNKIHIKRLDLNLKSFLNTEKLTGFNINIAGRIKGIQRAKFFNYKKGIVKANSFTNIIQAKQNFIFTKWGKYGLKTCLSII